MTTLPREIEPILHEAEVADFVEEIKSLLQDPRFAFREGLSCAEQTRASYERLALVHERLPIRCKDVLEDPRRLFALHEWVGTVDGTLMTLLAIHYSLSLGSILQHGRDRDDLDDYVKELEEMSTIGVFLATEQGFGNNVGRLETTAVHDPERREFVIHTPGPRARKFMPNTGLRGVPKLAIVMARLRVADEDHGVFPFIVRIRDARGELCPGVQVQPLGDKPVYSLDNAITWFDQVRVPERNWLHGASSRLDEQGRFESSEPSRNRRFMDAMDRVQLSRIALCGSIVSVLRAAVFIATRYSHARKTFAVGRPEAAIIEYRNHQRDLFGSLATAYALTVGTRYMQRSYMSIDDESRGAVSQILAILKAVSTYAAQDELFRCRERVGAVGLFDENRIPVYLNQAQGLITAEGDNHLILMKAAREMLSGVGYEMPELPSELDPEAASLVDAEYTIALFRIRERKLCLEVRESMEKAFAAGREPFAVWNDHVNAALRLARARGERVLIEQFHGAVERIEEPETRAAVERLRALHALQLLARDTGWFLAEGLVSTTHAKTIELEIDELCRLILPDAEALVDAFGISNDWLRAPIAEEDYVAAYERRGRCESNG